MQEEAEGCWAASAGCRKEVAKEALSHLVRFRVCNQEEDERAVKGVFGLES